MILRRIEKDGYETTYYFRRRRKRHPIRAMRRLLWRTLARFRRRVAPLLPGLELSAGVICMMVFLVNCDSEVYTGGNIAAMICSGLYITLYILFGDWRL